MTGPEPTQAHIDDAALLESVQTVIRLARIAQQICEEVGLTLPQYRSLIHSRQRRRAYELAKYNAVTRPAISALTAGLERANLIERSYDEGDGRAVYFAITAHGHELLARAEQLLVERFAAVLGDARDSLALLDNTAIIAALDREIDAGFPIVGVSADPGSA